MTEAMNDRIILRRLTAADVDAFRVMRLRALSDHPHAYLQTYDDEQPRPVAYHNAMLANNIILGAFLDDRLVGYTILSGFNQSKIQHKASIWGAYVDPDYRKLDLGKRMRLRLFEIAGMLGLKSCTSVIVADNIAALRMHRAVGYIEMFREKDGIRHHDGQFDDLIHLIKYL